jgi:Flp pilus assembly pilin Flp
MRSRNRRRRGVSAGQWCIVAVAITLVIVAAITILGNNTNTKLNQTATDLSNPHNLTTRFGS